MKPIIRIVIRFLRRRFCIGYLVWCYMIIYDIKLRSDKILQESDSDLSYYIWLIDLGNRVRIKTWHKTMTRLELWIRYHHFSFIQDCFYSNACFTFTVKMSRSQHSGTHMAYKGIPCLFFISLWHLELLHESILLEIYILNLLSITAVDIKLFHNWFRSN